MSSDTPSVRWVDDCAIVTLPAEIDITNRDEVRDTMLGVLGRGPASLIADMTATTFCDSAGVHALIAVRRRAVAANIGFLLVLSSAVVFRILRILEVHKLIPVHPDLASALAACRSRGGGAGLPHAADGR
jgi:anti-sigma B factor antagonist